MLVTKRVQSRCIGRIHFPVFWRRHFSKKRWSLKSSNKIRPFCLGYPLGGVGDVNTYAVFADLFRQAVGADGRAGLIVPNGLVTGFTYREFLGHLLRTNTLASFFGFENEEKLFRSVHNETKFGLLTITGSSQQVDQPWFTAHLRQPSQIMDSERRYALTLDEIEAINPNTLNLPTFRWRKDADVTAAIHQAASVLIRKQADGSDLNPWGVEFVRLFDMANDSGLFLDHQDVTPMVEGRCGAAAILQDGSQVYPLYEGKMFWHFDHRYGTYEGQTERQANKGVLPRVSDEKHADPAYRVQPRYWVDASTTLEALADRASNQWFISWRDVGPSERTLVIAIIPKSAVGHASPILFSNVNPTDRVAIVGILSSLVVDYAVRQKSNRMTFFVLEQVPILNLSHVHREEDFLGGTVADWLATRVFELSFTSEELAPLAADLGRNHPPFRWQSERRAALQTEIDAAVLHLYCLDRSQAEWLLDSFTVLKKYEERDHDEFRTKRLVLEIYDEMAAAKREGRVFESRLNPPAADPSCCHPA